MADKETAAPAAGDESSPPAGTAVSTPAAAGPMDDTGTPPEGEGRGKSRLTERVISWPGLFFLLPAMLLLGVVVVWPIIYTVYRSFYGQQIADFVGLDNYKDMFTDKS